MKSQAVDVRDKSSRSSVYDFVRVIAAFAVIVTHNARLIPPSCRTSSMVQAGVLANALTRWCVPIFVMLSGALLLDPTKSTSVLGFYRRRFRRILIPTLFWSIFYSYLCLQPFPPQSIRMKELGIRLAQGAPSNHLWFMFMLMGLYAVAPFFAIWVERLSSRTVSLLSAALLCAHAIDSTYVALLGDIGYRNATFLLSWFPYVGYFLLGAVLTRMSNLSREMASKLLFIFLVLLSGSVLLRAFMPDNTPTREHFMSSYNNPMTTLESVVLFILLLKSESMQALSFRFHRLLSPISSASFGIYLAHYWIADLLSWISFPSLCNGSVGMAMGVLLAWSLLLFAMCTTLTLLLLRVPYLRRTV